MEQNVIAPLEPAKMDVEAMTRKRARGVAAMKKLRVITIVVKACTKLSSGLGMHCAVELDARLDGDFSEEPEQARSEIESEILAVLSTQMSSARLDEEPLPDESLVASRHEGHCIAHPEAQRRMLPPPPATSFGCLFNPNQDQQERSKPFEEAVGTMFTSPSEGLGFISVDHFPFNNRAPTADDVSKNIPNQGHPTGQQTESGQSEQHMSPNAEAGPLDYLYKDPELPCFNDLFQHAPQPIARLEGLVEESLHVATTSISKEGDAIQSGMTDQLLEQVDPNPQEQVDPTPQEQRGPSELESQPIPEWRKLASNMNREIEKTIAKVDQESYRGKLQDVKSKVTENSNRLKRTFQKLREKFQCFLDNFRRLLKSLRNGVSLSNVANPRTEQGELDWQQQELTRNISSLLHSLITISEKLDGLVKPLQAAEDKTMELFQKCAQSVCLTVESFFEKQADVH